MLPLVAGRRPRPSPQRRRRSVHTVMKTRWERLLAHVPRGSSERERVRERAAEVRPREHGLRNRRRHTCAERGVGRALDRCTCDATIGTDLEPDLDRARRGRLRAARFHLRLHRVDRRRDHRAVEERARVIPGAPAVLAAARPPGLGLSGRYGRRLFRRGTSGCRRCRFARCAIRAARDERERQ